MKYKLIICIFTAVYSINLFADNLLNFSYSASGSFISNTPSSSEDDVNPKFRYLSDYQNGRYEINYQFCNSLCYGFGAGYWQQSYILGKYSGQNPLYLSYKADTQFSYLSFQFFKPLSNYSEGGLYFHLGQENIQISPYAGLASESQNNSYIMIEGGPFFRLGLETSKIILKRVYIESGAQVGLRMNNDIVLNNETIEARSMGKFTLLLYIGLGISL